MVIATLRVRGLFGYGIEKLQHILLLLQHTLPVSKAANLWQFAGLAIKIATETRAMMSQIPHKI